MSSALRGATSWLIVINLVLAAALAWLWLAPGWPAQWRNWQAPHLQAPTLDDVHSAVLVPNPAAGAAYPGTLARPLMNPARRPMAATPVAAASAPPAAIDQVKLLGIVAGPALSGVLIEHEGNARFVRRGERVGDWELDSLRGREARFMRGDEQRVIELPFAHGADGLPPAAKVPGPVASPAPAARPAPVRPGVTLQAHPTTRAVPTPAEDASSAPQGPSFGGT